MNENANIGISLSQEDLKDALAKGVREHLYAQEAMGISNTSQVAAAAIKEAIAAGLTKELLERAAKSAIHEFLQSNREEVLEAARPGFLAGMQMDVVGADAEEEEQFETNATKEE